MNKRLADKGRRIGKEYVFCPGGFGLDWDKIGQMYPQPDCYLVAVDEKQIALLLSLFKFLRLQWLWGFGPRSSWDAALFSKWDEISSWVSELEGCLMSGCAVGDLKASIDRLTAAVAGEQITIDGVQYDYTQTGISPVLENLAANTFPLSNLNTLANIESAISNLDLSVAVLPAAPTITVEPSPVPVTVEVAATDVSGIVTALAGLSNLDRLTDITDNLAHLQPIADEIAAIEGDLNALAAIADSLAAIDADLNSLNDITAALREIYGAEITLDNLVGEMTVKLAENPDYEFKDWLEILNLIKGLFGGAGSLPMGLLSSLLQMFFEWRFKHNLLTALNYQATAQRGIMNALAPFGEEDVTGEESAVGEIYSVLDKIPWLLTAMGAVVEPTPAGETAIAVKVAASAGAWLGRAKSIWETVLGWFSYDPGEPQPRGTVWGAVMELARRTRADGDTYAAADPDAPSVFGAMLALQKLADNLPEGVTLVDLVNSITAQLTAVATNVSTINTTLDAELTAVATNVNTVAANVTAVATNVQNVTVTVDAPEGGDMFDLIAKLEEIRVSLETKLTAETIAGNTRSAELEAVLNAIENVLGGTYEP